MSIEDIHASYHASSYLKEILRRGVKTKDPSVINFLRLDVWHMYEVESTLAGLQVDLDLQHKFNCQETKPVETKCPVCGEQQLSCPGGLSCPNGHGM